MDRLLQGKVAAITGSGSSIGRAASLLFAREGARIVAADLDPVAAAATAAKVREQGGEAVYCACDVADPAAVDALIAAAVDSFARLDIVFNNSGIAIRPRSAPPKRKLKEGEPASARLYSISVDGLRGVCRAAMRQFQAQGSGGVIVTADLIARLLDYGGIRYDVHRSEVAKLTAELALEAAEHGIRVNAFSPGGMSASFTAESGTVDEGSTVEEDGNEASPPPNPLSCAITPEACANVALFLASDLSEAVTGVNLPVDGGLWATHAQRA